MILEAREGEMKLEESDEKRNQLRSLLMANTLPVENDEDTANNIKKNKEKSKGKSKKGKPGERKPKRDATGWSTEKTESETNADAV